MPQKYNYPVFEKAKQDHKLYNSSFDANLFNDMINDLALKPKDELPYVIGYLKDIKYLIDINEMTSSKYSGLSKTGKDLIKLIEVTDRLWRYYFWPNMQNLAIKKFPKTIRDNFPIMHKFFGQNLFDAPLMRAVMNADVMNDYPQYLHELNCIFAARNESSYLMKEDFYNYLEGINLPSAKQNLFAHDIALQNRVICDLFDKVYNKLVICDLPALMPHMEIFIEQLLISKENVLEMIYRFNDIGINSNTSKFAYMLGCVKNDELNQLVSSCLSEIINDNQSEINIGFIDLFVMSYQSCNIDKQTCGKFINRAELNSSEGLNRYINQIHEYSKYIRHPMSSHEKIINAKNSSVFLNTKEIFIKAQQMWPTKDVDNNFLQQEVRSTLNAEKFQDKWNLATKIEKENLAQLFLQETLFETMWTIGTPGDELNEIGKLVCNDDLRMKNHLVLSDGDKVFPNDLHKFIKVIQEQNLQNDMFNKLINSEMFYILNQYKVKNIGGEFFSHCKEIVASKQDYLDTEKVELTMNFLGFLELAVSHQEQQISPEQREKE